MRFEPRPMQKVTYFKANVRSHEEHQPLKTARQSPWKSEPAQECVTTHWPKWLVSKMDVAKALFTLKPKRKEVLLWYSNQKKKKCSVCKVTKRTYRNFRNNLRWNKSLVQILVAVASTQMRQLYKKKKKSLKKKERQICSYATSFHFYNKFGLYGF